MSRRVLGWAGMCVTYLAVTSDLSLANVLVAAVVAAALAAALPGGRRLDVRGAAGAAVALVLHLGLLVLDTVRNGFVVAGLVLRGRGRLRPGVVTLPNRQSRPLAAALEAHAITISPGQMVLDFDDAGEAYAVHELNVDASSDTVESDRRAALVARIAACKRRQSSESPSSFDGGDA